MCHWISDNNFNADFLSAGVTKRNHPLPRSAALRNGLSLGRSTKRLNFRRPVSVFSPPPLRNRIAAVRRSPLRSGLPQGFIQVPLGGIFPPNFGNSPQEFQDCLDFYVAEKMIRYCIAASEFGLLEVKIDPCAQQTNGSDCGVYASVFLFEWATSRQCLLMLT